jgi:hypothetical protein
MDSRIALVAVLALSIGTSAQAQSAGRCTRETLSVRGTPLTVSYCVTRVADAAPGRDLPVEVAENFSTPRGAWSQQTTLRFIAGEEASRVIEDLPLSRVGLAGVLHMTLLLRGGSVHVDSAMLTPGAVSIK